MASYYANILNSLNLNPELQALKNALEAANAKIDKLEEENRTLEAKLKSEQTANYMNKCTIRGLNDTIKACYNTNIDLERKINVLEVRTFVLEGQLLGKEADNAELRQAFNDYVNKN